MHYASGNVILYILCRGLLSIVSWLLAVYTGLHSGNNQLLTSRPPFGILLLRA